MNGIKTQDFLAMLNENIAKRIKLDVKNSQLTDCHQVAQEACAELAIEDFEMQYATWHLIPISRGYGVYDMRCFHLDVNGFEKYKTKQRYGIKGRWKKPPEYKLMEGLNHEYLEGVILQAYKVWLEKRIDGANELITERKNQLRDLINNLKDEEKQLTEIKQKLSK